MIFGWQRGNRKETCRFVGPNSDSGGMGQGESSGSSITLEIYSHPSKIKFRLAGNISPNIWLTGNLQIMTKM